MRAIRGLENLPSKGPALIVSNHLSYYDFLVLGSFLKPPVVFVATMGLDKRPLVGWFTRFDVVIYINREKPGYTFFRDIVRHLHVGRLVIVYPEGTRSRTGRMLRPKLGFVKIALQGNIPIIPVAVRGTFEILPPHRHVPSLRRCEIFIGKRIYISPQSEMFSDIFFNQRGDRKFEKLEDWEMQLIANRIMDSIRRISGQEWEEPSQMGQLETLLAQRRQYLQNNVEGKADVKIEPKQWKKAEKET